MPTQIRLSPQQIADLTAIRDLGDERLRGVVERLQGLDPLPLRPSQIHHEVLIALGNEERATQHVLRPLLALYQLIRQRELTVDEVIDGLRDGIGSAEPPWTDDQRTAGKRRAGASRVVFGACSSVGLKSDRLGI